MGRLFMMNGGEVWGQIAKTVREKSHWRGELVAVCKGGKQLPVYMAASRGESDEQRSSHIACFVRDISMEKEINDMKSQFVSVASHELRMPLTSIKNAVNIILAGKTGAINQGQERFLSLAKRNIDRMTALVNNLHDIYEMEFNFTNMDIRVCVGNVNKIFQPLADNKSIALNTVIESGLPNVYADASRIEEVMLNLVANALNFTSENGTVTIDLHTVKTVLDAPENISGVEVSVIDNGIGIPDEFIDLDFEKFYQAESSLSAEERAGMGLSLAICKRTIEAHSGKIMWESKKGEGSTFRFTLPVFSL